MSLRYETIKIERGLNVSYHGTTPLPLTLKMSQAYTKFVNQFFARYAEENPSEARATSNSLQVYLELHRAVKGRRFNNINKHNLLVDFSFGVD